MLKLEEDQQNEEIMSGAKSTKYKPVDDYSRNQMFTNNTVTYEPMSSMQEIPSYI